ncbi:MAG: hypothetical protein H5T86_06915 [Armatimonadetes bacterium]|nr:hypothetical protein [Armatimonadota bacterium]
MESLRWLLLAAIGCCALVLIPISWPADGNQELIEGPGFAAAYPGDAGIERDSRVIFTEQFEETRIDDLQKRWEDVRNPEIMSLSSDVPPGSAGRQSLLMTHVGGRGTGGHLYRRLAPGYLKWFVRFYVKFAPNCYPIHHFFHVGGYNPPTPWPQGGAGERPRGNERFTIGIEPYGKAWKWDYYAYWKDMRGSPPAGKTWGNAFIWGSNPPVKLGEWTCVELMVKMNDPVAERNGELALWVDGKLVSHLGAGFPRGKWIWDKFLPGQGGKGLRWNYEKGGREEFDVPEGGEPFEGFMWRTDPSLKLNFLWVLLYITDAPAGHVSHVWFDHIVVARDYIGPLSRNM